MNPKYIFFNDVELHHAHSFSLNFIKIAHKTYKVFAEKKKLSSKFKTNLKIKTVLEQF